MEAQLDIKVYIAKYSIFPSGKNLFQITASDEVPVQFLAESKLPNSDRAVPRAGHAYRGKWCHSLSKTFACELEAENWYTSGSK